MKHFTKYPYKVTAATDILSFKCPSCKNKTLYSAEQDVHRAADVDENELFICDECGEEFRAHPQYNGSIQFTESIESATSVDDKKIDRRLSSTSKRYRGYRISLDSRHKRYNIYDAHGKLEDHGFKSVEDAMAHIDELVSIESATYNVYSSKQSCVRRKSTHHPVTSAEKRTDDSIRKAYKAVKATTYPQGTYWMAKYKDINGNLHKIVFQFDSQDFDEAEEEMDAVITEPYTAGRLLGRCNPELAEKDGFVVLSSQDIHCAEEIEDDIQEISQEFTYL